MPKTSTQYSIIYLSNVILINMSLKTETESCFWGFLSSWHYHLSQVLGNVNDVDHMVKRENAILPNPSAIIEFMTERALFLT